MSRREGQDLFRKSHQVFRFAGEDHDAPGVIAVIERTDADGIPGGDELAGPAVVEDAGELRVQHGEHIGPVFEIEGQKDLAVAVRLKDVPFPPQTFALLFKSVKLAVADDVATVKRKGLHA